MLFSTPTQFAVLALLFVAGFVLGLASHPGGRKWRRKYDDERTAHARLRDEIAAERKAAEREQAASHARVRELEAEVAAAHAPATAVVPPAPVGAPAVRTVEAQPAAVATGSEADDLGRIRGLDRAGAARLRDVGITRYAEIEDLTAEGEADLERRIGAPAGYIARKHWREQAKLLREGKTDEFERRFGNA